MIRDNSIYFLFKPSTLSTALKTNGYSPEYRNIMSLITENCIINKKKKKDFYEKEKSIYHK